jgi:L-alanine-DL-glutamate epimerase-like enolase superfamily enzyme
MMGAHLAAIIPNFAIMETDVDDVPWKDDLVTQVPIIDKGMMSVPQGPGWGSEVNEEILKAHPPRFPHS